MIRHTISAAVATLAVAVATAAAAEDGASTAPAPSQGQTGSPEAVAIYESGVAANHAEQRGVGRQKFSEACELGHAMACSGLSIFYLAGSGVEADFETSVQFMARACELDHALSCTFLGTILVSSETYEIAHDVLDKACKLNDGDGCSSLGTIYYDGLGREADLARGVALFNQSCEMGSADGCFSYGGHLVNTEGERAYAMADIYFRRALELSPGHERATEARKVIGTAPEG